MIDKPLAISGFLPQIILNFKKQYDGDLQNKPHFLINLTRNEWLTHQELVYKGQDTLQ